MLPIDEHHLVMPDQYEGEDADDEGADVIDMRDMKTVGAVQFAEPQSSSESKANANPTQQLEEHYARDQTREQLRKSVQKGDKTTSH